MEKRYEYPFKEDPGREIARGFPLFGETKVLAHMQGWVLKESLYPWYNSLGRLKRNKSDYDFFRKHLGKHIPETHFIRGVNAKGKPKNFIVQKEVDGRRLSDFTDGDFAENIEARHNLIEFFRACVRMWDTEGRMPDFLWGTVVNMQIGFLQPRYSSNVIIENETNNVYLVDTTAPEPYFSKKFPFSFQNEVIKRNIRHTVKRLEGFSARRHGRR